MKKLHAVQYTEYIRSGKKYKNRTYAASRRGIILEALTSQSIGLLAVGSFIAGFLKYMGIDDSTAGIIMALPAFGGIIQLFSPLVLERMRKRLKLNAILNITSRSMLSLMGLVPVFISAVNVRAAVFAAIYFTAYIIVFFGSPGWVTFLTAVVPPKMRGKFLGMRDSLSILAGTVATFAAGKILDYYKLLNREGTGFTIFFCIIGICTIFNAIVLLNLKEPPMQISKNPPVFKDILTKPFQYRPFKYVIFFTVIWAMTLNFGGPFVAIFFVSILKLDYTTIAIITLVTTLSMVIGARVWGNLSRKFTWSVILTASALLIAAAFLLYILITPENAFWLLLINSVFSGFGSSGANIAIFNVTVLRTPREGQTIYIGCNAFISSITGFLATLLASTIVRIAGSGIINMFGKQTGIIQLILIVEGILLVFVSFYSVYFLSHRTDYTR